MCFRFAHCLTGLLEAVVDICLTVYVVSIKSLALTTLPSPVSVSIKVCDVRQIRTRSKISKLGLALCRFWKVKILDITFSINSIGRTRLSEVPCVSQRAEVQ